VSSRSSNVERSAPGSPRTPVRRARAIGAAVGLSAASLLAWFGAVAQTPVAAASPVLASVCPGSLGALRGARLDTRQRPPAGIEATARRALRCAPLAYEPFTAAAARGFANNASGATRDAALLREAIRRNPRARSARLLLLRHAIAGGRLTEAIGQLAALDRLRNPTALQIVNSLGKAIKTEAQVSEAVSAMRQSPALFRPFLQGFTATAKPAPVVVALTTALPKSILADRDNSRLIINQLVGAGQLSLARDIWANGLGRPQAGLLHSPDFSDSTSLPPFNWELAENTTGAAERRSGGGLSVSYYGRVPGPLVTQLLALEPGSYRATLSYRTEAGVPGAIGLGVRCGVQGALLREERLAARAGQRAVLRLDFSVPAQGCPGQLLSLHGRPTEERDPQDVLLERITLERTR
jgi:hypothetical protein